MIISTTIYSQKPPHCFITIETDCHYIVHGLPSVQTGEKKEIHQALIWFLNVLFAYRHWQPENIPARNVKLTTRSVFQLFSLKISFLTHPERQARLCFYQCFSKRQEAWWLSCGHWMLMKTISGCVRFIKD